MIPGSTREFIFMVMWPSGRDASAAIRSSMRLRIPIRRHCERSIAGLTAVAGQIVEEIGEVGTEIGVRGEDTDVLVDSCRGLVVVPGPDVGIADDTVTFPAHDKCDLGVGLQPDDAVHDMHTGILETLRPLDVAFLVETGLQLDQGYHLLAPLRGIDE